MARIMAFDVGRVRIGVAVTDPMQMIAIGLTTVNASEIMTFVSDYLKQESVERFIVGLPRQMDGTDSESMFFVQKMIQNLKQKFPHIPVEQEDERFTSKLAQRVILESGIGKKKRQNKALLDQISATIILQSYLENR
ncbi:MAG: Holliday junction resolvase RuvX [Paludibacteraceae bacterium]|nr:Holliday junction resolvase RuvX [Paludibacteraceae bacterium]